MAEVDLIDLTTGNGCKTISTRLRQTNIRDAFKVVKSTEGRSEAVCRKRKRTDGLLSQRRPNHFFDYRQQPQTITSLRNEEAVAPDDYKPTPFTVAEGSRLKTSAQQSHLDLKSNTPHSKTTAPIEIADDESDDDRITLPSRNDRTYLTKDRLRSSNDSGGLTILNSIRNGFSEHNSIASTEGSTSAREQGTKTGQSLDDYMSDNDLQKYIRNLRLEETENQRRASEACWQIQSYKRNGVSFAAGKGLEFHDGSFFRIDTVMQNGHGEVFVGGKRLVRENFQGTMMPKRRNELVWVQFVNGESSEGHEASIVSIKEPMRNREIVFTNQRYPMVSSRDDDSSFEDSHQDVSHGPLFCRWRKTQVMDGKGHVIEEAIEHLSFDQADDKSRRSRSGGTVATRLTAQQLRFGWRQATTALGGSNKVQEEVVDPNGNVQGSTRQAYTFGDAFCGAGGVSRGAHDAGLSIKWAFDNDSQAMDTYTANFAPHGADCHQVSVDGFIRRAQGKPPLVDILHISPPCQPFSPAHTIPSLERDEMNQATLFSVRQLTELCKPRVVTIEETFGLKSFHPEWFSALIYIFIDLGYSVRWKILRCDDYGVPQTRKRLFIIASGPGEKLPPFALPTHARNDPHLKSPTTIEDMIQNIPQSFADHDPSSCRFDDGKPRPPYDARTQAKTVTCGGGMGNYHPSGLRPFTIREFACLQTFPLHHKFIGARGKTAARKQIGNAVPPVIARTMFRRIIKALRASDAEEARQHGD